MMSHHLQTEFVGKVLVCDDIVAVSKVWCIGDQGGCLSGAGGVCAGRRFSVLDSDALSSP